MANTVSSPRISSPTISSPASSVRPSLDIPAAGHANGRRPSPSPSPNPAISRRNRTALRDYYNLNSANIAAGARSPSRAASIASTASTITNATATAASALTLQGEALPLIDSPDFSPESYVQNLLSTSSLSSILRAESTLVSEIKNLDGERKALVYDNYSKLIRATETIAQLQKGMDDQAGTGGLKTMESLGPAVETVATTAAEIQNARQGTCGKKRREVNTVKWVLDAPERFELLIEAGKAEDAQEQWQEVSQLLDAWKHVKGADEVREACLKTLERSNSQAETDGD